MGYKYGRGSAPPPQMPGLLIALPGPAQRQCHDETDESHDRPSASSRSPVREADAAAVLARDGGRDGGAGGVVIAERQDTGRARGSRRWSGARGEDRLVRLGLAVRSGIAG